MADEPNKEEATTPEPEVNAASILAEMTLESEESEESKADKADEDEPEDKAEDDDEKEDPEPDDNDEEKDDELDESDSKLALDPAIADKLPPEVKSRYEQQVKGVEKLKRQLDERDNSIGYQTYQGLENAMFEQGPEKALAALAALEKAVKDHHKVVEKKEEQEPVELGDSWQYDGKTFYSLAEIELYKETQALKAEVEAMKSSKDPRLEELFQEREQAKTEQALTQWVDGNSQRIIAKVAAKTGGWGVTKEQIAAVAKADKALLESDPIKALKREFPDEFADWKAKDTKKPIRDMVTNSEAKGFVIPDDPDEYSAKHALMEIGN